MLFYRPHREHSKISHVTLKLCCAVYHAPVRQVLTVEGVGVFLLSPEISGLGGTLVELPELLMCLSP